MCFLNKFKKKTYMFVSRYLICMSSNLLFIAGLFNYLINIYDRLTLLKS